MSFDVDMTYTQFLRSRGHIFLKLRDSDVKWRDSKNIVITFYMLFMVLFRVVKSDLPYDAYFWRFGILPVFVTS